MHCHSSNQQPRVGRGILVSPRQCSRAGHPRVTGVSVPCRDFQNISRQGGGSKSKSRRQSGGGLASSVSRLDRMSASMGRLDMMSLGVDISRPPSHGKLTNPMRCSISTSCELSWVFPGPLGARGRHEPAGALSPLRQPSERFKRGHSNPTQLSRRWTAPGPALLLTGAPDALLDQLPW